MKGRGLRYWWTPLAFVVSLAGYGGCIVVAAAIDAGLLLGGPLALALGMTAAAIGTVGAIALAFG